MSNRKVRQKPLLSIPQILIILALVAAMIVALDLNRRAQAGRQVNVGEDALRAEIMAQQTRQVQLEATATHVYDDSYIEIYARNEGSLILDDETLVSPLFIDALPTPTPIPTATPDPAGNANPWQAWWRLLTDAPQPAP